MSKQRIMHYVPSSHWDREWYLPFQYYRHKLVQLMDGLLNDLDSGHFVGPFTGDGQAILIEDYLTIRPEKTEALQKHIAEGDIILGPWYVMPDEFLVSGESLIRNIRYGREIVRRLGGTPSDAGFVCDLFGHNSQMPQLLKGFGIRGAFVWRGVDIKSGARIKWIGADGTGLPTYRFGKSGYCDYTYKVRHSTEPNTAFDAARAQKELKQFIEEELDRVGEGPGLLFDGGDHLFVDPQHYEIIKDFIAKDEAGYKVIHSSLDAFLEEMIASDAEATELVGELREPARWPTSEDQQFLIPGVTSGRVWIKQENATCESLLCQWLEPFAALANQAIGCEYPYMYLEQAWKWLLKNHPHDSICGCSIDQVHEDMKFRFSQCRQIAEVCLNETLTALAVSTEGDLDERERRLAIFNPLPEARDEVFELDIEIPADWPEFAEFFGYEPKPAFKLFDSEGEEIPYQRLATKRDSIRKRTGRIKYPQAYKVHVVRIAARLKLPSLGGAVFTLRGQSKGAFEADHLGNLDVIATRYPCAPGLRTGHTEMENEWIKIQIQANGAITLYDKRSEQVYESLNLFEDDSDIGDGWNHGPTANQRNILAGQAQIELDCDTPLLTRFIVRQTLDLPKEFDTRTTARSVERNPLMVESHITLRSDADSVDIETHIKNTVGNHRLRALFPTTTASETYLADTPFDVVERPISLRTDNHLYRELEVDTKPQQSWTACFDNDRGLAVVTSGGSLETAIIDRPDKPIALTLYRATDRTVLTDGEPEGQLIGHNLTFRYRIQPLQGKPDVKSLFSHSQDMAGGLKTLHLDQIDLERTRLDLEISERPNTVNSLLSLEGTGVLTSLRLVNDALECRLFNPSTDQTEIKLSGLDETGTSAVQCVDLESTPAAAGTAIQTDKGTLAFSCSPKEIKTLRL